jgi:oxygen-independent coproporphyrinogen-3 oxidase
VKSAEVPADQREHLLEHESLTDFCHMHLRVMSGLPEAALRQKFSGETVHQVLPRLAALENGGLLMRENGAWKLTTRGQLISNKVFEELTFSQQELKPSGLTAQTADSYCSDHERERRKYGSPA